MRRDDDEFLALDLELVYIAKSLDEAQTLETKLTESGADYSIETDTYLGGTIFHSERTGVFFYVMPDAAERIRATLRSLGYRPHEAAPNA